MPEIKSTSFYNHTSYGASYYTSYIGLENFISPLVFRGDKSRIFLSSDDYENAKIGLIVNIQITK